MPNKKKEPTWHCSWTPTPSRAGSRPPTSQQPTRPISPSRAPQAWTTSATGSMRRAARCSPRRSTRCRDRQQRAPRGPRPRGRRDLCGLRGHLNELPFVLRNRPGAVEPAPGGSGEGHAAARRSNCRAAVLAEPLGCPTRAAGAQPPTPRSGEQHDEHPATGPGPGTSPGSSDTSRASPPVQLDEGWLASLAPRRASTPRTEGPKPARRRRFDLPDSRDTAYGLGPILHQGRLRRTSPDATPPTIPGD